MRYLIRYITRKSRGGLAVRDEVGDREKITIGRGNDCNMHLPDPRVLLHHAEVDIRNGIPYVSANADADIRLNDNLTHIGRLEIGDKVRIGPYEIESIPNLEGFDVCLGVELVDALGDDLEKLVAQSRIKIDRIGLTVRAWAWLLGSAVLIGTFFVPFVLNLLLAPHAGGAAPTAGGLALATQKYEVSHTGVWSTGSISAAHKFFGASCETCHKAPFVQVRDEACQGCHSEIATHAQPARFPFHGLGSESCQSCHKEHQGNVTVVQRSEGFCAGCHNDLTTKTTVSGLSNVSDFADGHPEFRPSVMKIPASREVDRSRSMSGTPLPAEHSGLKFPHDRHLRDTGVKDPTRGNVVLACADCHVPTNGGSSMRVITFERDCHGCHALKFDKALPGREIMHGKPQEVFKQVQDIYDALAMRGGYEEETAPSVVRRRPGTVLLPEQKQVVADWAASKSAAVLNGPFGRGLCNECHHTVDAPVQTAGGATAGPTPLTWTIEPVALTETWMPKAQFNHARHSDVVCGDCHTAKTSNASSDVLMPGIAVCQSCHGSEQAVDRVPSTCVSCHRFHHKREPAAKSAKSEAVRPEGHP